MLLQMQIFLHIFDMDVKVPVQIPNVTLFLRCMYWPMSNRFIASERQVGNLSCKISNYWLLSVAF